MNLFSDATLQQAKQKMRSAPWAKAGWQALAQRVEDGLQQSIHIPAEAGGWIHNYVCGEHWMPLVYDGQKPTTHACPAGHVCEGEAFDAAWRVWRHRELADLAREGGLLWAVQGEESGRQVAAIILLQYADFYTLFAGQSDAESWMLQGHAFNQALTEALWAIPLIHAYDLVGDSLTAEQRTRIERDLLRPMGDLMVRSQEKLIAKGSLRSNYMAWINVTLVCLGYVLGEQDWVTRALSAPVGLENHLNAAVFADGLEYEATPYYHTFVLLAYAISAEAARANGIDLYDLAGEQGQSLEKMGLACAQLSWPNGMLPDLGDGSYWQDSIFDSEICQTYELINGVKPHAEFGELLYAAYRRRGTERDNWAALIFGTTKLTSAETPPSSPSHTFLEESGIAVLRTNKELAALVPFGPYRGEHHHADRLSLSVWPFSQDPGSPLYGLPARRGWYPHSYAHNTLVVDEQSHANCGGELLEWSGRSLYVSAPDAYPGVFIDRAVTISAEGVIRDELDVQANRARIFDWVFHIDGQCTLPKNLESCQMPLTETGPGAFIQVQGTLHVSEPLDIQIKFGEHTFQLTLNGERPFTLLVGLAPGTSRHPRSKRHVLIGRTEGTHQRYRTTIKQIS